jgi:hypothetical protein
MHLLICFDALRFRTIFFSKLFDIQSSEMFITVVVVNSNFFIIELENNSKNVSYKKI